MISRAHGMEDSTDIGIELVELVYCFSTVNIPEDPIIQNQVIRRVKGRPVACIVVGFILVIQLHDAPTSCDIIDLDK